MPVENDDYKQKEIVKLKGRNKKSARVKAGLKNWIFKLDTSV